MLYLTIQPDIGIPFTVNRALYRNDGSKRIWLTYSSKHSALFCSICLAFGIVCDKNTFTLGVNDWRHIYQRIEEHKKRKTHGYSVDAYFLKNSSDSVDQLLIYDQCNLRKKQVEEKRQVLTRIIDIINLNLVICDVTENKVEALSLFGLLNCCAVIIRESYKRMDICLEMCSNKRLGTIGQTRWWAKDIALSINLDILMNKTVVFILI